MNDSELAALIFVLSVVFTYVGIAVLACGRFLLGGLLILSVGLFWGVLLIWEKE